MSASTYVYSGSSGVHPPPVHSSPNTLFPPNPHPSDFHLHATLQRIDELANQDVEMQAPLSEFSTYLVLDTNVLLHNFEVLVQFVEDVERLLLPLIIVIPGVVIYELDRQKNRDGLAWFSRRASSWLLGKVRERKSVKVQANDNTCKKSKNWKVKEANEFGAERANDALILDCCSYFKRERQTWLCSSDKNLCVEANGGGFEIPTITPSRTWSSREIAHTIYGGRFLPAEINRFAAYRDSYKYPTSDSVPARVDDDDSMMVDDEAGDIPLQPSHALDLLHLQVIDHFTRLLIELVARVGGPDVQQCGPSNGASTSRYAPRWQQKNQALLYWDASDCLEYLTSKKPIKSSNPSIDVFMSKPYATRGARRGQDWSRRDWEVALTTLGKIGDAWGEYSIQESLMVLEPHWNNIFALKLRPTGI